MEMEMRRWEMWLLADVVEADSGAEKTRTGGPANARPGRPGLATVDPALGMAGARRPSGIWHLAGGEGSGAPNNKTLLGSTVFCRL